MAEVSRITDLPSGAADLALDIEIMFSLPGGGGTRKATLAQFLAFLNIPVDTLTNLGSPGPGDFIAFGSNVRKSGEGAGNGTGSIVSATNQAAYHTPDDAAATS